MYFLKIVPLEMYGKLERIIIEKFTLIIFYCIIIFNRGYTKH